jgi:heterodisulfide reductase subunit A
MSLPVVFLCKCFGEIEETIGISDLKEKVQRGANVSRIEIFESLCLEEDFHKAASIIKESVEGKLLIAACSPLSRASVIVSGLVKTGKIGISDIELVDIREGCAWIHGGELEEANQKAYDLVRMGLASLEHKEHSEDARVEVCPEALILGAGPAGLSAACSLARIGLKSHLVETAGKPGGMLNLITRLFPENETASETIKPYLDIAAANPLIKFYSRTKILSAEGVVGDFKVRLAGEGRDFSLRAGAIIIATGAKVVIPHGLFGYGEVRNVITQMELERRFKTGAVQAKKTVFIQCVGARDQSRPYCSTICCPASLKNAMRLMEETPNSRVFVLHRDIMTPGKIVEEYYRKAISSGILLIRYDEKRPPQIKGNGAVKVVEVWDVISGTYRSIDTDLVVLSTPLEPKEDNATLAKVLGVELDQYGFFRGNDPVHPLETSTEGVFICGSARWPVSARHAIEQGEAAAIKAASFLKMEKIGASTLGLFPDTYPFKARVNITRCTGCGNCVAVCPFEACHIQEKEKLSAVNTFRCKGCGSCAAVCPGGAIQVPEQSFYSIAEMINHSFQQQSRFNEVTAVTKDSTSNRGSPGVIVFACRWCSFIGLHGAGKKRFPLPASFRVVPVECAGRVESSLVLMALAKGIQGVAILGCHQGGCRHNNANHIAQRRLELLKDFLDFVGIGGTRLLINWGEAHEPYQFAEILIGFLDRLKKVPVQEFRKQLRRHIQ